MRERVTHNNDDELVGEEGAQHDGKDIARHLQVKEENIAKLKQNQITSARPTDIETEKEGESGRDVKRQCQMRER